MHFTEQEWVEFVNGRTEERKRRAMEEHLYECGECVEMFLSCITKRHIESAENTLSPEFTRNVMAKVEWGERKKETSVGRYNAFCYYAAAACITIMLMGAGVFEGLAKTIPYISKLQVDNKDVIRLETGDLVKFGWSDTLMDKTLSVFDAIKPKEVLP